MMTKKKETLQGANFNELGRSVHKSEEVSPQAAIKRLILFLLGGYGVITGILLLVLATVLHSVAQVGAIVLAEIGAVLLATSILHLAYEHILRQQYEIDMLKSLKKAVKKELHDPKNIKALIVAARKDYQSYRSFIKHGIVAVHYPDVSSEAIREHLSKSSRIRILKTWFPESVQLETGLRNALENSSTSIELLLCDPELDLLRIRSLSAGEGPNEGTHRVIRALELLYKLRCGSMQSCFEDGEKCTCKIGLYKTWPGSPIIWCDDLIYLGYYFVGKSSLQNPWIEVKPNSELGKILDAQFEWFWKQPDTYRFKNCADLKQWLVDHGGKSH